MESNLQELEVIEGYYQFKDYINSDFNKQLIIKTVENSLNSSEWPMSYYQLRDDRLPGMLGEQASRFFFWAALGGFNTPEIDITFIQEDKKLMDFMNYIIYNYSLKFIQAKNHNHNPMGFSSLNFTFAQSNEHFNLFLTRNDNEKIHFRLDSEDSSELISDLLEYFSKMVSVESVLFNLHELDELISSIEDSLYVLKDYNSRIVNEMEGD